MMNANKNLLSEKGISIKRARILLRVSSDQQLETDGDLTVQRQLVLDYVKKHSEWILDEKEYFEGSNSGYKNPVADRQVLQEAYQDAQKGEYNVLVVYKDDRIGRRMWEIGGYVMSLKGLGVDIYTVKDGCISPESDDIMGQMMLALRYGNAQKSSADTGMRVKDTAKKLVQAGKFMGGKAPYGYVLELSGEISKHGRALKHLVIHPEQAETVRHIYHLSLYKEYGSAKIAALLNLDDRYKSLAPHGVWKSGTITSILTNPIYAGYTAYNRREKLNGRHRSLDASEWILSQKPNPDLVVIGEDTWRKVQEKREMRSPKSRNPLNGTQPPKSALPKIQNSGYKKILCDSPLSQPKPQETQQMQETQGTQEAQNTERTSLCDSQLLQSHFPEKQHYKYEKPLKYSNTAPIRRNGGMLSLIDILYCGYCGCKMTNGSKYNYWTIKGTGERKTSRTPIYKCQNAWQGVPHDSPKQFRADFVEPIVYKALAEYIDALQWKDEVFELLSAQEAQETQVRQQELNAAQKNLGQISRGISVMESHIPDAMTGEYPLTLEALIHNINLQKQKKEKQKSLVQEKETLLKKHLAKIKDRNNRKKTMPSWHNLFPRTDVSLKRVLANHIIERIDITKERIVIRFKI